MSNIANDIIRYQKKIKDEETGLHQAEGSQKEILRNLKDLGINSIRAAEKEIIKLEKKFDALEQEEKEIAKALENGYVWY